MPPHLHLTGNFSLNSGGCPPHHQKFLPKWRKEEEEGHCHFRLDSKTCFIKNNCGKKRKSWRVAAKVWIRKTWAATTCIFSPVRNANWTNEWSICLPVVSLVWKITTSACIRPMTFSTKCKRTWCKFGTPISQVSTSLQNCWMFVASFALKRFRDKRQGTTTKARSASPDRLPEASFLEHL